MNKKKVKPIYIFLFVIVFCIAIFGITYAFFNKVGNTNVIGNASTAGKLDVIYTNGQNISGMIYPSVDNSTALTTTATVRKTSASVDGYATVNLNISTIDSAFATTAFKWEVYDDLESEPINYGNFSGKSANDVIKLVEDYELTTVDTTFTVKIWLDSELNTNNIVGKAFSAYIDVTAINIPAVASPRSTMKTVFAISGTCQFRGSSQLILGDTCRNDLTNTSYTDRYYIDTGVQLFKDAETTDKDFIIYFEIVEWTGSNQPEEQSTILNSKWEKQASKWPGFVIRRSSNNVNFAYRNGSPGESISKTFSHTNDPNGINTTKVTVIRKNRILCYKVNDGALVYGGNTTAITPYFTTPVTIGASLTDAGVPQRYSIVTLKNISIQIGEIQDDNLICPTS